MAVASLLVTLLATVDTARSEDFHIPLPPPSGFPNPGIELPWPELNRGVAASQESFWDEAQAPDVIDPNDISFTGCTWQWYGRYGFAFEIAESAELEYPARLRLTLLNTVRGSAFRGWTYEVIVTEPGVFTMLLDNNEQSAFWRGAGFTGGRTWFHQDWPVDDTTLPGCSASLSGPLGTEPTELGAQRPTIAVAPPESSFGNRTLESLVASIDPTAEDANLRPLAALLSESDLPRFDRIYVAPNTKLVRIEVDIEGTCVRISSDYERGVHVEQSRGCARPAPKPANQRRVRDRIWRVVISGPAQPRAAVRQDLIRFRAKSLPLQKQGGKPMRPAKWLDAVMDDTSLDELARFRWKKGFVAIINHRQGRLGRFADPIIVTPRVQQVSGSGVQCLEWNQYLQSSPTGGFAYIVTDEQISAVLSTSPEQIVFEFVEAGRRRVGFADLTGHPNTNLSELEIRTQSGTPLACDESL